MYLCTWLMIIPCFLHIQKDISFAQLVFHVLCFHKALMLIICVCVCGARISKISSQVVVAKKSQFVGRLQSYWALKRQSRNGVPLLRRLQSSHMNRSKDQVRTGRNMYSYSITPHLYELGPTQGDCAMCMIS